MGGTKRTLTGHRNGESDIETLTELTRRQAYRIEELEATLQGLMVAFAWHVRSCGDAIDDAQKALDADQDPIIDRPRR